MTTKTIDTETITDEMRDKFNEWFSGDRWNIDEPITIIMEAAPSVQGEPSARDAFRTIWTHHSAQAETTPWTAMYIFDGENPFDRLSQFGEMAGQKYGNSEIEAIAALIGNSEKPESEGCDPQKACVSGGCPNKTECDSAQYCLYTAKKA